VPHTTGTPDYLPGSGFLRVASVSNNISFSVLSHIEWVSGFTEQLKIFSPLAGEIE
jgi:hypothetical protein